MDFINQDKNLGEVIREGIHSETLRSNPAFTSAVQELYDAYVSAEDNLTAANAENVGRQRHHYSMMRLVLKDLVSLIDAKILEGQNATFQQENNGE